jgi:uncharacterized membrane protein YbhN (UPF0104 family)
VNENSRPPIGLGWRRMVFGIAAALLAAAVVLGGIGKLAGFEELRRTLRGGEHAWLALSAAAQLLVFGGYAAVYRGAVAFEGGPRIGRGLSLRVVLAAFALTQTVAFGGAAGVAVHYWAMRRLRFDRQQSAVRVIGFNTLVYLVFGLLGFGAALLALAAGQAPPALAVPWLVAIPMLLLAAAWFTEAGRVERWAASGGGWLRRGLAVGVGAAWWVRRTLRSPGGRSIYLAACVYWLGTTVGLWASLRAFGAEVGAAAFLLAFATGYAAQFVPLPFVATGGVDAATTFALTAVGVPLEVALLGVAANRIFSFWLPIWPALAMVVLLPATGQALERAGRPAAEAARVRIAT